MEREQTASLVARSASTHVPDSIVGIRATAKDAYSAPPAPGGDYPKWVAVHPSYGRPPYPQWPDFAIDRVTGEVRVRVNSPEEEEKLRHGQI